MVSIDDPANCMECKISIVVCIYKAIPQRDHTNQDEMETGSDVVFLSMKC